MTGARVNGAEASMSQLSPGKRACVQMLERYLAEARAGKVVLAGVVLVYDVHSAKSDMAGGVGYEMEANLAADVLKTSLLGNFMSRHQPAPLLELCGTMGRA